jgi:hypothetical protein
MSKRIKTVTGPVADRQSTERLDCTVQALSRCLTVSYCEAHKMLAENGRQDGAGHFLILSKMQDTCREKWIVRHTYHVARRRKLRTLHSRCSQNRSLPT